MSDKPESNLERERKMQETFDALRKKRGAEKVEQSERGDAWLEERAKNLPEELRQEVRAFDKRLEAKGIKDPAARAEEVEEKIATNERLFQDQRFTVGEGERMANLEYGKKRAVEIVKEFIDDPNGKPEDLKKVAFLGFDANGLKGVNDLSTHINGTEYLKRIAEAIHDPESKVAKWLKEQGIQEILPMSAGGGDEYGVLIRADKPLDGKLIETAVRMYEDEIAGKDVSDLVDFEDVDVQKKLKDKGVKMKTPAGFKMRASASGGGSTLFDGMAAALENPNESKRLSEGDTTGAVLNKIMGGTWDSADHSATRVKDAYKAGLTEAPEGSADRYYGEVLTLGRKSAEDTVAQEKLKTRKMEALGEEIMAAAEQAMDGLMSKESFQAFKKQKQAEIAALKAQE